MQLTGWYERVVRQVRRRPWRVAGPDAPWWLRPPTVGTRHHFEAFEEWERRLAHRFDRGRLRAVHLPSGYARFFRALFSRERMPLGDWVARSPDLLTREVLHQVRRRGQIHGMRNLEDGLNCFGDEAMVRAMLRVALQDVLRAGMSVAEARQLWRHAHATALAMDRIRLGLRGERDLTLYMLALFHDIGRAVVTWTLDHEAGGPLVTDLKAQLRDRFHGQAGRLLAKKWGMPLHFRAWIGKHHEPLDIGAAEVEARACLALADQAALHCGYGEEWPEGVLLEHPAAVMLGIDDERAAEIFTPLPDILVTTLGPADPW